MRISDWSSDVCSSDLRFFPDGNVSKSGTFIQLSGGMAGPDGLALDEDDNLLVCHMGMGSVWKFSRLGEPLLRIRSPQGILTSNCAFGGKDNKTLFITNSETATTLAEIGRASCREKRGQYGEIS